MGEFIKINLLRIFLQSRSAYCSSGGDSNTNVYESWVVWECLCNCWPLLTMGSYCVYFSLAIGPVLWFLVDSSRTKTIQQWSSQTNITVSGRTISENDSSHSTCHRRACLSVNRIRCAMNLFVFNRLKFIVVERECGDLFTTRVCHSCC